MQDCVLRVAVSYNDGTLFARKDTPIPEPVVKGPRFQQATLQVGTSLSPSAPPKCGASSFSPRGGPMDARAAT